MKRCGEILVLLFCTVSLGATIISPATAHGNGIQEAFESPETSWRLVETDCRPLQLAGHERQFNEAHSGRGSEHIQLIGGQGTYAYFAHDILPARVIREVTPSVWVKSDRHGLQLMARIVLPRSLHDGKPVTSFLFGDRYETAGVWRQLRIDDVLTKLQREVVALRTQRGSQLDEREAYIDLLVLNAYTGPGLTNIWIDDLEVGGFAPAQVGGVARPDPSVGPTGNGPLVIGTPGREESGATVQGNVLIASGRPLFVRSIDHRGETFAFLQSLGCNTVRLATTPTAGQLAEAERCGIWIMAPPSINSPTQGTSDLPTGPDRILAWYLGDRLTPRDWPEASGRADQVARRESEHSRPMVANVTQGWSVWRRNDVMMLYERPVLNTSFELQEFLPWLAYASQQSGSIAPFWVALATEPAAELEGQVARLAGHPTTASSIEPDQIRWLAFAAVAAGARGICFRSRARLDNQDPVTRQRAATLRQVNRELELVAPWASGGTASGELPANHPRVRVFGLQTERARLLILLRRAAEQQFVVAPTDPQPVRLTLQQPPATDQAYVVSPAGVDLLSSQRGGGLRIALDGSDVVSLVLLTSDPLAVNYAGRTANAIRRETASARLENAKLTLEETESIERSLKSRVASEQRSHQWLLDARAQLRQAEQLQDAGDSLNSLKASALAINSIRQVRRARWQQTVQAFTSPCASPLCTAYATLPDHFALSERLSSATWTGDVLAAGEMEHLEHLLTSGWKQQQAELSGVSTDVQLSLEHPRGGRSSLHLRAWELDPGSARLDGHSPVTIVSAPISVQAGQLLRVSGWVRAPQRLVASWDGLMIYDSHTGPQLAERIAETHGWREFTLYRVATSTAEWKLIFELTGLGEAWIDDVSVATLTERPRVGE